MFVESAPLQTALLAGFAFCLIWAAVSDILSRKIANVTSIACAALGVVYAVSAGDVLYHFLTAFAVLTLGFAAFARGWLGGGDAKLLAACALWMGPGHILTFLFFTAAAGGILALLWLFEDRFRFALARGGLNVQLGVTRALPYGVAIAAGGLAAIAAAI